MDTFTSPSHNLQKSHHGTTKGTEEWPPWGALHHLQCTEGPYSHQHTAKHPYTWNSRILSKITHRSPTNHLGPCAVICKRQIATNCTNSLFKSKLQCHPSSGFHLFLHRLSKDSVDLTGFLLTSLDSFYVTGTHHFLQV